tara:strand:- start:2915 stop:3205 length:291 start_codon:yes stop_codon:yes gene_type:complete
MKDFIGPENMEGLQQAAAEFDISTDDFVSALEFAVSIHSNAELDGLSMNQCFIACISAIGVLLQEEDSIADRHAKVLQMNILLDRAVGTTQMGSIQ